MSSDGGCKREFHKSYFDLITCVSIFMDPGLTCLLCFAELTPPSCGLKSYHELH